MLNENVVKVLKNNTWTVATCAAGVPNAVPVGFKDVTEDGKLVVGDVFLETTMRNVLDNGKIAVSAYDASTSEGYQVKGCLLYTSQFTVSALYSVINDRLMAHKPVILSTNLSPEELRTRYSAQIASRILGTYQVLQFLGNDIRMKT